jgi:hypothetical protein
MKQLAQALNEVMKEVKGIEKNLTVGIGKSSYSGVADKDVKLIIGSAMQKHGLSIIPIDIEPQVQVDRWEETYNGVVRNKQQVFTSVKTKYLLLHTSGESVEVAGYGHGVDSQDKSAPKATTFALKNALLYLTMAPTGVIDGDFDHSNSTSVPPQAQPVAEDELPMLNKKDDAYNDIVKYVKDNTDKDFDVLLKNVNTKYRTGKLIINALKKEHAGGSN